ncbi:MAG: OmpH family outer membrane protein [Sphingomonas oligoaromativorans]
MTKIFKSALLVATAAVSFAAIPALADSSVLVVDFDQVFQNSAAAKSGTQQLRTKYDSQLSARRTAFQSAAQAYNTQVESAKKTAKPGTPIPAATQSALQQAGERAQAAEQALQEVQQEVNQAAAYVRQQIIEHAGPVAEQIRAERKAAIVMSKDATLASDPAADVTTTLVQRLDASFPTPSIVVPQQGAAPAAATTTPGNPKATQGR